MADALIWLVVIGVIVLMLISAMRPRRRAPGPAALGSMYDFLHEDKRKALEIVVEQRAAERDEEHVDGNLPDLEHPAGSGAPEVVPPGRTS